MWNYKKSYRLEQEILSGQKKIEKFETMVKEAALKRMDPQPELYMSRNVRRLEFSCSRSLEKGDRLRQEISVCGDKTCRLEELLRSCQHRITELERALRSLEDRKLALQHQVSKTEEKNAAVEVALESMQQRTRFLDRGDAQLKVAIIECESRSRTLQSEKKSLEGELAKVRAEIFTLKSRINKLTREINQISYKLSERRKRGGRRDQKYPNFPVFIDGEGSEDTSQPNETKRNYEKGDPLGVLNTGENPAITDVKRLKKPTQDKTKLWGELREAKQNDENNGQEYANKPRVSDTFASFPDRQQRLEAQDKSESSSELNERKKSVLESNQENAETLRVFHTSRCFPNGQNHEDKSLGKTKFSTELGQRKKDNERDDQDERNVVRQMCSTSTNLSEGVNCEETIPKGRFTFDTHNENETGKFQELAAELETKFSSFQSEEGSLEGDLVELRTKISILESHINKLIQEKTELFNELNKAKENAGKSDQRNDKIHYFNSSNSFTDGENLEGTIQPFCFFPEIYKGNSEDETRKLQGITTELETKLATCKSEEKSLEGELMKLRENWIFALESHINKLIRDRTELLAELSETKEAGEKSDQWNVDTFHYSNTSSSFTHSEDLAKTTQKDRFFVETHNEKTADEIRKLRELAAELETKYFTCKAEVEKHQALIDALISCEETETGEAARGLQLKLDESYLDLEERDVMIQALAEDKRRLECIIQEFALNDGQKCDSCNAENEKIRSFCLRPKKGTRKSEQKLRDFKTTRQQPLEIIVPERDRQTTEASLASGYNSQEQKKATLLNKRDKNSRHDYAKQDEFGIIEVRNTSESILQGEGEQEKVLSQGRSLTEKNSVTWEQGELGEIRINSSQRQFRGSLGPANRKASFEWKIPDSDYERKYRESCHGEKALKTTMATEESIEHTQSELDRKASEFNGTCEVHQPDVDVVQPESSNAASEAGVCVSVLESQKQSSDVVVAYNGSEMISTDEELANGHASPVPAQDENGGDDVTSADLASDDFSALGSQEDDNPVVVSQGNEISSIDSEVNFGTSDASPVAAQEENGADAVTSAEAESTADIFSAITSQEENGPVVSNGNEIPSHESELTSDTSPESLAAQEENVSDAGVSGDIVTGDFLALKKRKESLQELCDVLMEERDRATSSLKEKNDEVLRLRKLALDSEQEKGNFRNQLAKALGRSVLAEKEVINAKEENENLRAEIVRLTKRIEELEAENTDLKSQLEKTRANQDYVPTDHSESVPLSHVDELQEEPPFIVTPSAGEDEDKRQEIPNVADNTETADEPKRAEVASTDDANESESAASENVVRRRDRAAKRAAPNYFRHSLAGSLPRPYHSYELPRQSSREDASQHERSGSFHSDTSGESAESEGGSNPASSLPNFMRRADKPSFLKSGYSPVQFNYHPLPESISHRRESFDAHMMRARGGSWSRTRSSSSDGDSIDSGTRNHEPMERLSREQHANELISAPDDLDGGLKKRADEIETEEYGVTVQITSMPAPDVTKDDDNSKNSKDLISEPTASTQESHANFPLQGEEHVESNDRLQVHAEEQEKREHVSDLVNIWNRRTSEVIDI